MNPKLTNDIKSFAVNQIVEDVYQGIFERSEKMKTMLYEEMGFYGLKQQQGNGKSPKEACAVLLETFGRESFISFAINEGFSSSFIVKVVSLVASRKELTI